MQETWVQFLVWKDPLEEGMATHSSILAWRIAMDGGAWRFAVHEELDMTKRSTYYIFKNYLIKSNNIEDTNSFLNFSESSLTCKQNLQIFWHQ